MDALSEDGAHGLTLIAFIGSVFSPFYAWSGRKDPLNHCAMNVAIYGRGGRWAMTERGREDVRRDATTLAIGPSHLSWDGEVLTADLREVAVPIPLPIRGTVRIRPTAITTRAYTLDANGRHTWWPIAPRAEIEVDLTRPDLKWSGLGYLDTNYGTESLEDGFIYWNWCRAGLENGEATILYNVNRRDGTDHALALCFDPSGNVLEYEPPPAARLPRTMWLMARDTRVDAGHTPRVIKTLEDTPFYTRSVLSSHLRGQPVTAMHESLSLDRFRNPVVRQMLPYRMPRGWRWF